MSENSIVKVLTEALAGTDPSTFGCEVMADIGRPDIVSLGIRFETREEAATFVAALTRLATEAHPQLRPASERPPAPYIHAAPDKVQ